MLGTTVNLFAQPMAKVIIIQSVVKQYRLPFFAQLHDKLSKEGIELIVAYSDPPVAHAVRNDNVMLPPSWGLKVPGHWLFNRLLYQPVWRFVAEADLAIVGPELKYIINPALLVLSALAQNTVAFWGLGPNRFPDRSPIAEWIKLPMFTRVNWWFAYTETVADFLTAKGMPADRITIVRNATDTAEMRRLISEISDDEARSVKHALTGSSDSLVGLYCGMMHKIKSLPFLIETARLVRAEIPNFHLVLIGDGPERERVARAISGDSWIHYLGSRFGSEKAMCFKLADVLLLGGTAGLVVVDSFAAGLPVLATRLSTHPPEISYIVEGVNGCLAPHDTRDFSRIIVDVLSDSITLNKLRDGAMEASRLYSIETMVDNFATGIKRCLVRSGVTTFASAAQYAATA